MEGAIVGPLLSCLVTDQFLRIKQGDSHWYERPVGPQRFSIGKFFFLFLHLTIFDGAFQCVFLFRFVLDQLKQIYNTTLASILCRNSDAVEHSQPFVMQQIRSDNEITNCQLLDTFDFSPWIYDPLAKSVTNFVKVQNNEIKAVHFVSNTSANDDPNVRINL